MKRLICILLALGLALSGVYMCAAEGKSIKLGVADISESSGVTVTETQVHTLNAGNWFKFSDVDMTGISSVKLTVRNMIDGNGNGETLAVVADSTEGECLGYVVLSEHDNDNDVFPEASLKALSGKHDLYFICMYGTSNGNHLVVKGVELSDKVYKNNASDYVVPDSAIIDNWSDTWVATDSMGRRVAEYEDAGPVRNDGREVGTAYWNWFYSGFTINVGAVIPDIIAEKPEAQYDYDDPIWPTNGKYYWGRPIFGFFTSYDYWVIRKDAEMLANAGIDVIFYDATNGGKGYIPMITVMVEALRDSKASGVDIPRLSCFCGGADEVTQMVMAIYAHCFVENDFSDIWYYRDGKPFIFGSSLAREDNIKAFSDKQLPAGQALLAETREHMTSRNWGGSSADAKFGSNAWFWLDAFPQVLRNPDETGRPEFITVGAGKNKTNYSTQKGISYDAFSNQDAWSRAYSAVFGDDYSENAARKAYFFREEAALALDAEPEFVLCGQWNEWTAIRYKEFIGNKNAFVDLYNYDKSRDFAPTDGLLKDDYYMMMADFVRKFKGVRPTPVLTGQTAIDIYSGDEAWSGVGPEFINSYQNYERDALGFLNAETGERWHYTTEVVNSIKSAKVSTDENYIYFYVTCEEPVKEGTSGWMNLYLNIDRNYATGWEGFDFAVNVTGAGRVSKFSDGQWLLSDIGTAEYSVSGNSLRLKVSRELLGETGTIDFEFKWSDNILPEGDFMQFYKNGSSAPYGRFNYLATEIAQTSLSADDRFMLRNTAVLKAWAPKMVVGGAKMYVYEPDIRYTAIEKNNMLYVPQDAFSEIMGYGRSKTKYDSTHKELLTYHYDMNEELTATENYIWAHSTVGSYEVRINGVLHMLSNPVIEEYGLVYIPLSLLEECYGWMIEDRGDGVWYVMRDEVSDDLLSAAADIIE